MVFLFFSGDLDSRLQENVEYFKSLKTLSEIICEKQKNKIIEFVKSFNDSTKQKLFNSCHAVIYTPLNEHFGIVPIEGLLLFHTSLSDVLLVFKEFFTILEQS